MLPKISIILKRWKEKYFYIRQRLRNVPFWLELHLSNAAAFNRLEAYIEAQEANRVKLVRLKPLVEEVIKLLANKTFDLVAMTIVPTSLRKAAKKRAWLETKKRA
ncbi:Uncharacterized protein Adt_05546 [Abeliophyllum distichum]|uniref:Uncharacterized protein n=1 Tax=Abeliophyllum distichum TaxID=126358 RepID=A0ABD1V4E1_9LAMI